MIGARSRQWPSDASVADRTPDNAGRRQARPQPHRWSVIDCASDRRRHCLPGAARCQNGGRLSCARQVVAPGWRGGGSAAVTILLAR